MWTTAYIRVPCCGRAGVGERDPVEYGDYSVNQSTLNLVGGRTHGEGCRTSQIALTCPIPSPLTASHVSTIEGQPRWPVISGHGRWHHAIGIHRPIKPANHRPAKDHPIEDQPGGRRMSAGCWVCTRISLGNRHSKVRYWLVKSRWR